MSLFSGISTAKSSNKSEFYNGGELYVIRLSGHEMRESENPQNVGVTFINARANVLETSDPWRPAGTSVVEMFKLKPAMNEKQNLSVNGPALSRLRAHGEAVYRGMLEQKRDSGDEAFADLTDEQIQAEVYGMSSDDNQFKTFMESLTEANAGRDIVLGVSTTAIKTKEGKDFTQITYTTDVESIRALIAQRKAEAA